MFSSQMNIEFYSKLENLCLEDNKKIKMGISSVRNAKFDYYSFLIISIKTPKDKLNEEVKEMKEYFQMF